tara:strand:- start:112 stop:978 length:867 start_codon:yes stop_codon:yes gene_type:complete
MAVDTYALTTLANLKTWLGIGDSGSDGFLENLIDRTSDYLESLCDRKFKARDFVEWYDGDGTNRLQLDQWPVVKVYRVGYGVSDALSISGNVAGDISASVMVRHDNVSVNRIASNGTVTNTDFAYSSYKTTDTLASAINSTTGFSATSAVNTSVKWLHPVGGVDVVDTTYTVTYASDSESEYRIDHDSGSVYLRSSPHWYQTNTDVLEAQRFPGTKRSILVEYKAGYETLPDDVEQACIEVAAALYSRKDVDDNLASESLGDYSYSIRPPADVMESAMRMLAPYRKIR